ncbi:MAG: RagB/SusD family nutrient uptake outer membrane protein [Bacteroidales bacterium]|nr:RagB/SusD family nutrient uptake outer membrane protein [Bacteroidales bacterium]
MRKLYISSIGALLMAISAACTSDFLEVEPTTTIPTEQSYNTRAKMEKALVAAYAPLGWLDYTFSEYHPIDFLCDILADDYCGVGGSNEGDVPYLHLTAKYTLTPELAPAGLWRALYSGVFRANQVTDNIDVAPDIPEAVRTRILAEARTLRAFYYYYLWMLWGNIPYFDVNPNGADVPYIAPQQSAEEVYQHIIEDLDFAVAGNNLPEAVAIDQVGRFNRPAAMMLRARCILAAVDAGRYQAALSDMRTIIGSGIYDLNPDFAALWEDEGEWCCESIFEVNYNDSPSNRTWTDPLSPGGTIFPTFICPDSYKGSRFASEGYGFGPVNKALYEAYAEGDIRRDGGILNFAVAQPNDSYNPRLDDSGFFNLKYMGRSNGHSEFIGTDGEFNFRNNRRVFRFAETLLNAAELIVRIGGDINEAGTYLNRVRARAFATDEATLAPELKSEASLANILRERRFEFPFEGMRFFDLVRFGVAEEVLASKGYTPNKRYLPIPQSEIDRAEGSLTQNPY